MHTLRLPGEQRIITYSSDGVFRVWDIALSPSGKTMASGNVDLAVKLWNVDTGKVTKTLTGHKRDVRSVDWSSDDERVVSASRDTTFRVWDVESGETILMAR
jgi:WD40 repeat protein